MTFGLFGTRFDIIEFLFGFVLGIFSVWGARRLRPVAKVGFKWLGEQIKAARENLTASTADPYVRDLLFRLDTHHLANPLFPLRQILVLPRFIAPIPPVDPTTEEIQPDRYQSILPPLPDLITLSGIYRTPTISCLRILGSPSNILITGEPGSGKTTALAFLAFEHLQKHSPRSSDNQRALIFLHAEDLLSNITDDEESVLNSIVSASRQGAASNLSAFIPRYMREQLKNNKVILMIDGLDEIPPDHLGELAAWLDVFVRSYPQHQIIAAGPPRGYDGLLKAGKFVPLAIAPWSMHEINTFLSKWAQAWQTDVLPNLPGDAIADVDPALINAWIRVSPPVYMPLELTLKVWSSYVGDVQSPSLHSALRAYVRRIISPDEQHAAQLIGKAWIAAGKGALPESEIEQRTPLSSLIEANILRRHSKGKITFANPNVGAYLAAQSFALEGAPKISSVENWQPALLAWRYYASIGDMTNTIAVIKDEMNDPLKRALFIFAAWLRDAPAEAHWRNHILSPLAKIIQDDSQAYGIRLRALDAIINANEQSAVALFRKMLNATTRESQVLGALGLGGLRHSESVPELLSKNSPQAYDQVRFAVCAALAVTASSQALIGLGKLLIEGDDVSQLFAAEALASLDGEGFSMLEDAIGMEKVRIRRAAVYGLGRAINDRAEEILKTVEMEDDQAIVRNAALEVLEGRRALPPILSSKPERLSDLPWLISFAAEKGLGVTPGKGSLEALRRALSGGNKLQRIAALQAVGRFSIAELMLDVLKAMEADDLQIKDSASEALRHLDACGVDYQAAFKQDVSVQSG